MIKIVGIRCLVFIMIVTLTVGLTACGSNSKAVTKDNVAGNNEKFIIKLATNISAEHIASKLGTDPFIDRIEKLGKGKVEIEYYPAGQIGDTESLLRVVKNKVADIAFIAPNGYGDVMPLSEVFEVPGIVQDARSGTKAYNKLIMEDLYELEFKSNGVKPLWSATLPPYQIVNSKHPITRIEDFSGVKIRTAGGIQELITAQLGAMPVLMAGPEMYNAWERGTVDGSFISYISWPSYQLESIAKYATANAQLSSNGFSFVVNEEIWNTWPDFVKDAVSQASKEMPEKFGTEIHAMEEQLKKEYKSTTDIEFYELSADELQNWNNGMANIGKQWAENLNSKGMPATEVLDKFIEYNELYQ